MRDAVGHRVVHGGARFREPVVVDEEVKARSRELSRSRRCTTRRRSTAIEAAQRALPDVPHVAVFDTAFHATMPGGGGDVRRARAVARGMGHPPLRLPRPLGAVGGRARARAAAVVCHLGGGCSVTAVRDGRSVDTTMGFTRSKACR